KFTSIDEWIKQSGLTQPVKETKLGNLKAIEVKLNDKIILAAIDQGILFSIEATLNQNPDFWNKVYGKTIADFSFVTPTQASKTGGGDGGSASDVTFEGEEVVE